MKFGISSFCLPAKIYLALAILSIVVSLIISTETIIASIIHFVFAIFWTWVLNLICKSGFGIISWILVLFPIVMYAFLIFYILFLIRKAVKIDKEENKATSQQTAPVVFTYK